MYILSKKNPAQYARDIQNLDKIRLYFAGLIDEKEELLERQIGEGIFHGYHCFHFKIENEDVPA